MYIHRPRAGARNFRILDGEKEMIFVAARARELRTALLDMHQTAWDFTELHQAGLVEYDVAVTNDLQTELKDLERALHQFLHTNHD